MNNTRSIPTSNDENIFEEYDGGINTFAALIGMCIIATVCCFLPCVLCRCWWSRSSSSSRSNNRGREYFHDDNGSLSLTKETNDRITIILSLLLMSISAIFFIAYFGALQTDFNKVDYKGLVRVTGVKYVTEKNPEAYASGSHYLVVYPVFMFDWGYGWACPNKEGPTKQCQSELALGYKKGKKPTCTQRIQNSDASAAEEAARACLSEKGYIQDESDLKNGSFVPFDPLAGPSQDAYWPSMIAYGNCNTCTISWYASNPNLIALPITGSVVFGLMLVLACGAFLESEGYF